MVRAASAMAGGIFSWGAPRRLWRPWPGEEKHLQLDRPAPAGWRTPCWRGPGCHPAHLPASSSWWNGAFILSIFFIYKYSVCFGLAGSRHSSLSPFLINDICKVQDKVHKQMKKKIGFLLLRVYVFYARATPLNCKQLFMYMNTWD